MTVPRTCSKCGAPIRWAKTINNKGAPFEAKAKGNIVIENGVARVVKPGEGDYQSHFVTCTFAKGFRRKK